MNRCLNNDCQRESAVDINKKTILSVPLTGPQGRSPSKYETQCPDRPPSLCRMSAKSVQQRKTSCVDHKDRNDMWPTAASQFPQQFPSYSNRKCKKIAVFTYCSPHFCFPWRRPCDYHASCCMDGKAIQCLPNSSQHVAIYLQ